MKYSVKKYFLLGVIVVVAIFFDAVDTLISLILAQKKILELTDQITLNLTPCHKTRHRNQKKGCESKEKTTSYKACDEYPEAVYNSIPSNWVLPATIFCKDVEEATQDPNGPTTLSPKIENIFSQLKNMKFMDVPDQYNKLLNELKKIYQTTTQ